MQRALVCLLLLIPALEACAMPSPPQPAPQQVLHRPARYMLQTEGMTPALDDVARQAYLDALWAQVDPPAGSRLRWLRQMAVGGDVVLIEGISNVAQLQRVVDALAALPQVQLLEPDGRNVIMPIRGPQIER